MTFASRLRSILLALATGYFLSVLYLGLQETVVNYLYSSNVLLLNGMNIGGDFSIFYVAGKMFNTARSELYNFSLQLKLLRSMFAGTKYDQIWLVFVYPPPVAAFFSMLSDYSLFDAYIIWLTISVCIFVISSALVISMLEATALIKGFIFLSGISFVPFLFDCLGAGQLSVLGLAILSLGMYFRKKENEWLEGFVLGFGFYKPPLFMFLGLLALVERRWRVVGGAMISGLILLLFSYLLVGAEQLINYFVLATNYRYGQEQTAGVSLPTFRGVGLFALLSQSGMPSKVVYFLFVSILLVMLLSMRVLKKVVTKQNTKLVFLVYSAEIVFSVLFSVQCINYDLTLILPALYVVFGFILFAPMDRVNAILLLLVGLFHLAWLFGSSRDGVEYAPIVPLLLLSLAIALLAATYKELNFRDFKRS